MSDQSRIQTLGPADPNAPVRSKSYAVLAVAFPIVGALATFGVLSVDQASAITGFATAALGLAGAFGFGFVSHKTSKQVHNGTFDEAPVAAPPPISLENVAAVRDELDNVIIGAVTTAAGGLKQLAGLIPGGTAATNVVMSGPVGDLVQGVADLLGDGRR